MISAKKNTSFTHQIGRIHKHNAINKGAAILPKPGFSQKNAVGPDRENAVELDLDV